MHEGLVLEIYRDYVVVLTNSGEFLKLRKKGMVNIGDVYKQKIYRKQPLYYYAAAAIIVFVLTSFAGYNAYASQIVGYVDITGSKNVRLYVNRKGTVQKIDGLENAKEIKNLPVYKAVEKLAAIAPKEGIYTEESSIDVSAKKIKDSKFNFSEVNDKVKNIISNSNKKNSPSDKKNSDTVNNNGEKSNNGNDSDKNSIKKNNNDKGSQKDPKDSESKKNENGSDDGKNKDKANGSEKDKEKVTGNQKVNTKK